MKSVGVAGVGVDNRAPAWAQVAYDVDHELNVELSYGEFGEWTLVGHGKQTNKYCGRFISFKGCLRVDLHNKIRLDGKNYKGKVFVRKVHKWCHKPSCPVCFKSGWAVREAERIEMRLEEASKRLGQVEHIVVSVPPKDYGLDFKWLRRKISKVLKSRGVVGGVIIFHGFRFNDVKMEWFWSPHFHVLGYIEGGYRRCRRCKYKSSCRADCDGFDARRWKGYLKDGYYVKVMGKRKTVGGTAWYQLNHSSVKKDAKYFHVATWFGVCSYRKMKVTPRKKKSVCPICGHDLINISYCGRCRFITNRNGAKYEQDTFEDYEEDGFVAWAERVKRSKWDKGELPIRVFKEYDFDKLFKTK